MDHIESLSILPQTFNIEHPVVLQYESDVRDGVNRIVEGNSEQEKDIDFEALSKILDQWLKEVREEYGDFVVIIFGSRIRGDFKTSFEIGEKSDTDVAIVYTPEDMKYDAEKLSKSGSPMSLHNQLVSLRSSLEGTIYEELAKQGVLEKKRPSFAEIRCQSFNMNELRKPNGVFGRYGVGKSHCELVMATSQDTLDQYLDEGIWLKGEKN